MMRHEKSHAKRRKRRRAFQTLEIIIILPICLIASIAAFEFGIAMVIQQAVTHASTVAAREAGKGADIDELVDVVDTVLATHNIEIGPNASIVLEDLNAVVPVDQRGTLACTPPATPLIGFDDVRVTVCVDMGAEPFLNVLWSYGIDFSGKTFTVSSLVKKEIPPP